MSIIERAARRIGLIEHDSTNVEGRDANADSLHKEDLIEKAVNESDKHTNFAESRDLGRVTSTRADDDAGKRFEAAGPARVLAAASMSRGVHRQPVNAGSGDTSSILYKIDRRRLDRSGMVQPEGARNPVAECIRLIKSQLLRNISRNRSALPSNLIMVTSSVEGEGKTFVATNLAISMAMERERRVLLVDGDVAKPSIPSVLGFEAEEGLMDVLDRGIDLAQVICKTDIGKLSVLPAGTVHQHATELLSSDRMSALAQGIAHHFDDRVVIFDSPPLLAASESGALATHMGQIVIVVEAGRTSEGVLMNALERIDSGNVAGTVLNKGWTPHRQYGYGYGQSN